MSPSVPAPWIAASPRVPGAGNPSVARAAAGPAAMDWNVAAVAAVAKADRGTGRAQGNGPGC